MSSLVLYMEQTLKGNLDCTVSIRIPILVTVEILILVLFKLVKCTNLDIKDATCLQVVHILQHSTSRPTTQSNQNMIVNDPKMNLVPLPPGSYGKWINSAIRWLHQAYNGTSSSKVESVWGCWTLSSLRFNLNPVVKNISKMYFSYWEPPGVSERMWSVNFEVSIWEEYQTVRGHSGWPWE